MSYQDIQVFTQLLSGALFLSVILGVIVYVVHPANADRFKKQAYSPLSDEEIETEPKRHG